MTNLFKKKFMRVPSITLADTTREIGRNAYVDWILILIVSAGIFVCLIAGGLYLYWEVSTGNYGNVEVQQVVEAKVLDVRELKAIVSKFNKKKEMSEQIRRDYTVLADPSR